MRNYWPQRNDLIQSAPRRIQRMQKVLTEMNVQLANGLSDLSGVTGQTIAKAILEGELAEFRDRRVKATQEQVAGSLGGGIGRKTCCSLLRQEREAYEFRQKQIAACDTQLEEYLKEQEDTGARMPN